MAQSAVLREIGPIVSVDQQAPNTL